MNIKVWSTALLILCLCPAAMAQKANRYLEKPLPQGWGKDASHAIPGDDNLFSGQIPPIDDKWWKAFDDPMLDSLITVASTQNYSVLSAMDRMDMAKANLRIERGGFFPSISLDGGWARQQSSSNVNALPQSITGAYSTSLNASWELDVFGSIRQRVKAQRETFMTSKEEYTSVMISLCAQIASAYIGLRELQQELSVVTTIAIPRQPYSTSPKYATKPDWYPSWTSRKPNPYITVPKPPSHNWRQASINTSRHSQSYSVLTPSISAPYWRSPANCPTIWNP